MTRIAEKNEWADGIYELRETDPVLGGADGISNRQAAQLASRTQWLKNALDTHKSAADPYPQYREATEALAGHVGELAEGVKSQAVTLTTLGSDVDELQAVVAAGLATIPAPPGTQLCFIQSTAPLGWTKVTRHNDKLLRIVSSAAGYGGSVPFTEAFAARSITGSIGATTLTEAQMPKHSHPLICQTVRGGTGSYGYAAWFRDVDSGHWSNLFYWGSTKSAANSGNSAVAGNSQSHTHSLEIDAPDFNVQYVDAIIASKDADA